MSIKKRKPTTQIDRSPPTHLSFDDLGGMDSIILDLETLVVVPLLNPELCSKRKLQPPRGILLHGPPGCGKTMLANVIAAELRVPFIALSATSIVSGMSGESEKALRDHFEEAKKVAPCLLFIDEIDAITPKRESTQREMEKRIVSQLLTCMDDLALEKTDGKRVIVLAATNRPDSLDSALRRGGRFDREINLSVPNEEVRFLILTALIREMEVSGQLNLAEIAKLTPGFVGADLKDLVSTAEFSAIGRHPKLVESEAIRTVVDPITRRSLALTHIRQLIDYCKDADRESFPVPSLTQADLIDAISKVQPSSKREGFTAIPDITWADIGALKSVREELITEFVDAIRFPEKYSRVGLTTPPGFLLWGPPGCGKTLLAKALANESQANFISVKGPELLNKYVGESERAVRQVFTRARSSVPCIIFFDEFDALVPKRDDTLSESSARVVSTFLTELDGLTNRHGIYVIAATNRPDKIDPAMLRPGRLETLIFIDLPGRDERVEILQTLTRKLGIPFSEDLAEVARKCEGFSGADLQSLLRKAQHVAVKRDDEIRVEDFVQARNGMQASVGNRESYARMQRSRRSGAWEGKCSL